MSDTATPPAATFDSTRPAVVINHLDITDTEVVSRRAAGPRAGAEPPSVLTTWATRTSAPSSCSPWLSEARAIAGAGGAGTPSVSSGSSRKWEKTAESSAVGGRRHGAGRRGSR